jgi:hypothetical protein
LKGVGGADIRRHSYRSCIRRIDLQQDTFNLPQTSHLRVVHIDFEAFSLPGGLKWLVDWQNGLASRPAS